MLGKDFWEDLDIDAAEFNVQIEVSAKALIDEWGSKLTEADLLKLNAYVHAQDKSIEGSIAASALEYYLTKDYNPQFIHYYESKKKAPWWKFWK